MKSGLSCKFQPDFVHPASNSTLAPPERKSTKLFAARISEFWEPDLPYSRQAPSRSLMQVRENASLTWPSQHPEAECFRKRPPEWAPHYDEHLKATEMNFENVSTGRDNA